MKRISRWSWAVMVLGLGAGGFVGAAVERSSHFVTIRGLQFTPRALQITVGETVVWTNHDDRDHSVTAADGSFESPKLGSGDRFNHTFDNAGTFEYVCRYHPREKGTVIASK